MEMGRKLELWTECVHESEMLKIWAHVRVCVSVYLCICVCVCVLNEHDREQKYQSRRHASEEY